MPESYRRALLGVAGAAAASLAYAASTADLGGVLAAGALFAAAVPAARGGIPALGALWCVALSGLVAAFAGVFGLSLVPAAALGMAVAAVAATRWAQRRIGPVLAFALVSGVAAVGASWAWARILGV